MHETSCLCIFKNLLALHSNQTDTVPWLLVAELEKSDMSKASTVNRTRKSISNNNNTRCKKREREKKKLFEHTHTRKAIKNVVHSKHIGLAEKLNARNVRKCAGTHEEKREEEEKEVM